MFNEAWQPTTEYLIRTKIIHRSYTAYKWPFGQPTEMQFFLHKKYMGLTIVERTPNFYFDSYTWGYCYVGPCKLRIKYETLIAKQKTDCEHTKNSVQHKSKSRPNCWLSLSNNLCWKINDASLLDELWWHITHLQFIWEFDEIVPSLVWLQSKMWYCGVLRRNHKKRLHLRGCVRAFLSINVYAQLRKHQWAYVKK